MRLAKIRKKLAAFRSAWIVSPTSKIFRHFVPRLEDEVTFLNYQSKLKASHNHVLKEAMEVLDIIDVKTTSLLTYISISFAAMVFLITSLPTTQSLRLLIWNDRVLTGALLVIIILLLTSIILCLSCLNIVGAQTIGSLKSEQNLSEAEYEKLIIRVSLSRRTRYLFAHRISVFTAVFLFCLFMWLFIGSVKGEHVISPPHSNFNDFPYE